MAAMWPKHVAKNHSVVALNIVSFIIVVYDVKIHMFIYACSQTWTLPFFQRNYYQSSNCDFVLHSDLETRPPLLVRAHSSTAIYLLSGQKQQYTEISFRDHSEKGEDNTKTSEWMAKGGWNAPLYWACSSTWIPWNDWRKSAWVRARNRKGQRQRGGESRCIVL